MLTTPGGVAGDRRRERNTGNPREGNDSLRPMACVNPYLQVEEVLEAEDRVIQVHDSPDG
ncbi:MAG: hypothetical protein PWR07_1652 [Bacillota bacterium]|nr:hypothetical protein [Bacillota bacterium]